MPLGYVVALLVGLWALSRAQKAPAGGANQGGQQGGAQKPAAQTPTGGGGNDWSSTIAGVTNLGRSVFNAFAGNNQHNDWSTDVGGSGQNPDGTQQYQGMPGDFTAQSGGVGGASGVLPGADDPKLNPSGSSSGSGSGSDVDPSTGAVYDPGLGDIPGYTTGNT